MADPLSLIVNICALASAAESSINLLARIASLRRASEEVLVLSNELSDIRLVLSDTETLVRRELCTPQIDPEQIQHLSVLVERAKKEVQDFEEYIEYYLTKPDSTQALPRIQKRRWLIAKHRIDCL